MHRKPSSPNDPLQRFVGSWHGEVIVESAGSEPQRYAQDNTFAWTLGDQFLEERGKGSNGSSFLGVWSLDSRTGMYRAHYFLAPSGDVVVLKHEWHAHEQTFSGSADLGGGMRMLAKDRFIDRDTYEWSITVQDGAGTTLTSMRARENRVSAPCPQ